MLALCAAAPGVAHAQRAPATDARAEARTLFGQAQRAYASADYAGALNLLRRAYALLPRPAFLFNIAQSQRKLGLCDEARASYQAYLLREENAAHRTRVERILRDMQDCEAAAPRVSPPTSAAAAGRSTPAATPPSSAALQPSRESSVPPLAPAADSGTGPGTHIVKWSLLGAGAVSAGLAVYFAFDARAASNDIENTSHWDSQMATRKERGQRSTTLAWLCGGAGAALLGAGVTLHLLSRPGPTARPSAALQIAPFTHGARASFSATF
ncbi:MAG TPA: tetratricopeptide repeat protein [Polyangiaceae bacterium]|nr:tetratricopeptide repeat protein [Polyangiaceae bacterium]